MNIKKLNEELLKVLKEDKEEDIFEAIIKYADNLGVSTTDLYEGDYEAIADFASKEIGDYVSPEKVEEIITNDYEDSMLEESLNEEDYRKINKNNINEISYQTKKSYLAGRQAQLDKAQAAMQKAQRLVRNTEQNKDGKRQLDEDKLKTLINNIYTEFPKYGQKYFSKEIFDNWGYLQTDEDIYQKVKNGCRIELNYDDQYLNIRIISTNSRGQVSLTQEKFSLDDFNFFKLNNKVLIYVKNFIKKSSKDNVQDDKVIGKYNKIAAQIKKLLSKVKEDKFSNDKFGKAVERYLGYSGLRKTCPAIVSIKNVTIPNKSEVDLDYQIKAIALTTDLDIMFFYYTDKQTRIDYIRLENLNTTPDDLLIGLTKILNILNDTVDTSGRSNLESQQKQLEEKKVLAKEAIQDVKRTLQSVDRNAEYNKIEEEDYGYYFSVREWGEWGDSRDWEEDNDFMNLQDKWRDRLAEIENNLSQKYPSLSINISPSEKRYLDCNVSWR